MAHIIVLGNEKGGSGKSTTSMHVATALARMGHVVGGLDLDLRQRSFARYMENRRATIAARGMDVGAPELMAHLQGLCTLEAASQAATIATHHNTMRSAAAADVFPGQDVSDGCHGGLAAGWLVSRQRLPTPPPPRLLLA